MFTSLYIDNQTTNGPTLPLSSDLTPTVLPLQQRVEDLSASDRFLLYAPPWPLWGPLLSDIVKHDGRRDTRSTHSGLLMSKCQTVAVIRKRNVKATNPAVNDPAVDDCQRSQEIIYSLIVFGDYREIIFALSTALFKR